MSLSKLPAECIHEIINCAENKKQILYKLLLVNKKLHRIAIPLLWRDPVMCESIIIKYLSELNTDEQKTLIPQRINLPPIKSYSRCAQYLEKLNLRSLFVSCVKFLVGSGYICQCGGTPIVRSIISSIIQMLLRETQNLKELSFMISEDEPDYPDISAFPPSQPGISSLHLSLEKTPVKDNVRLFIESLPNLCPNIREMTFIIRNDDEEISTLLIRLIETQLLYKFTLKCCSASAEKYIGILGSQRELRHLQLKELDFARIQGNPLNAVLQCEKLNQITISDSLGIVYDQNNLLATLGLNQNFNVTTTSPDLISITRINCI
ncbi:hypothetical protein C2G38_2188880 [Gigaspora rosea]|uniref:F-box domain-containing protein n=1 Tax=Gigaspora rosea TaxID=44941 RepID=A0A397VC23_9GLOM|nr:hypothetical protein C2G38_2188880 [Gigaspora rosea]